MPISPKEFEERKKEYRCEIIEDICDDIDDGLDELAAKKNIRWAFATSVGLESYMIDYLDDVCQKYIKAGWYEVFYKVKNNVNDNKLFDVDFVLLTKNNSNDWRQYTDINEWNLIKA